MSVAAATVCLIACHGGPADHFAVFAKKLLEARYEVRVYASGPALKKFQDHQVLVERSFNADSEADVITVAESCFAAIFVMTDVGHPSAITLQKTLTDRAPRVIRLAYYDNPEPYVPGGYSDVAAHVMQAAQKVLFANAHLAKEPLYQAPHQKVILDNACRLGLGYYPLSYAEKIALSRSEHHDERRAQFLAAQRIEERGQKIVVYFGGNNEVYFAQALPAFLRFLSEGAAELADVIFVMQQHPGAKAANRDLQQIAKQQSTTRMVISDQTSDDMLVLADRVLYYQTSMGPLFALAGIPMVQVGHETYADVTVKAGLCPSAANTADFIHAVKAESASGKGKEVILDKLGIQEDWFERLKEAL